jgi:hypothetical protein
MPTLYEPLLTCRGPGASDASTIEAGFDDFVHVPYTLFMDTY